MNEAKAVGNIGTAYEDRRNGKSGILMSRDDESKTLTFFGNGEEFTVSYAAFKSNWRKVKMSSDEEPAVEEAPEAEAQPVDDKHDINRVVGDEPEEAVNPFIDENEAGENFRSAVENAERKLEIYVQSGVTKVELDGIVILTAEPAGDVWSLRMLPDLFTFSNFKGLLVLNSIKFSLKVSDHLTVAVKTKPVTLGAIFAAITDATVDLNLYGYQEEDNDTNEETEEPTNAG